MINFELDGCSINQRLQQLPAAGSLCLDSKNGGSKLQIVMAVDVGLLCLDSKNGGSKLVCVDEGVRMKLCLDSKNGGSKLTTGTVCMK